MASTTVFPNQQQQPEDATSSSSSGSGYTATSASTSSSGGGSIGPFFAVISVLAVLTVMSCVLGRIYSRRQRAAESGRLQTVKQGGDCCGGGYGWLKGGRFGVRMGMVGRQDKADQVLGGDKTKVDQKVQDSV